jgi:hypothetical protein
MKGEERKEADSPLENKYYFFPQREKESKMIR